MSTTPARITVKRTDKGARVLASKRNPRGVHYFVDEVLIERDKQDPTAFRAALESAILSLMPKPKDKQS